MPDAGRWSLVFLAVVAVAVAGCVGGPSGTPATPTATGTAAPTEDVGAALPSVDGEIYRVTVVDVVDGDTVDVRYRNGSTDTVRLLGVDTPEGHVETNPDEFEGVPDSETGRQCLRRVGRTASSLAADRLDGETVRVVVDDRADRRGGFGRLLGYVVVDGENFNYRLVTDGYARVYDAPFTLRGQFSDAESEAVATGQRVWACRDRAASQTVPGA